MLKLDNEVFCANLLYHSIAETGVSKNFIFARTDNSIL